MPAQIHQITRSRGAPYAVYTSRGLTPRGTVTTDTSERIEWNYAEITTDKKGAKARSEWKFTFFPHNKKFAARVNFTGFRPIETVWGTCEGKRSYGSASKTVSPEPRRTIKPEAKLNNHLLKDPIAAADWNLIRISSTTKIYYHKYKDAMMVAGRFRLSGEMRQKIQRNDQLLLKFGFSWNDDVITPIKYDFNLQGTQNFQIGRFDNLDAIIVWDERVSAILQNERYYSYIWLQEGYDGAWAWRRTKEQ